MSRTLRAARKTVANHRRNPTTTAPGKKFKLEPDTDFSCRTTSNGPSKSSAAGRAGTATAPAKIPLIVAGEGVTGDRPQRECYDPSRPASSWPATARRTPETSIVPSSALSKTRTVGASKSAAERREVLAAVAHELRKARANLMGAAMADGGKDDCRIRSRSQRSSRLRRVLRQNGGVLR